jgi:glycogen operon protein
MDPYFLGARLLAANTEAGFRVHAPHATRVELWIYAAPVGAGPVFSQAMTQESDGTFAITLPLATLGSPPAGGAIYYGYRAWGPNWNFDPSWTPGSAAGFAADVDGNGNRFNPNKLLLDPYALEVSHNPLTPANPDPAAYDSGASSRLMDTGNFAPKGIVIDFPAPDFGAKPTGAFKDEIIYEVHLRGLTRNDPAVPANLRGTYAGAALRAPYLAGLGVTAVEFQPIHETQNALNDLPQFADLQNYWGYDSVSFFAPDRRYASDQSPGGPTREWIAMVKAFHAAGLKVFVDVVYNHHNEGNVDPRTGTIGSIYSLRGLDDPNYYEDAGPSSANFYQNDNGVGPNINAATAVVRNLVLDSLKYWSGALGADGFRFDLAAILGNENADGGYSFGGTDPDDILNRAVTELPARPDAGGTGVDLMAEPYTADANGQEQGNFPKGWSEWNDHYRDVFRASQNKLGVVPTTPGALATRFAGSDDLFRANGRAPWNAVNYLTCHDGMTLRDLYSFSQTQNGQPFPNGPSPGGRSSDQEMCWDHGGDPVAQIQAVRTGLAILFLSVGTPMLSGGSEIYRTQFGNNNAFNLDTVSNWLDWSQAAPQAALVNYTQQLMHFRSAHPSLRPATFFTGTDNNGNGLKDLTWLKNDASEVDQPYFDDPNNHFLAYRIDGSEFGDSVTSLYIAYNGWIDPISTTLPVNLPGKSWFLVADSSAAAEPWGNIYPPGQEKLLPSAPCSVAGRSLLLLMEK